MIQSYSYLVGGNQAAGESKRESMKTSSRRLSYSDPAADGVRAAKLDAKVAAALARRDFVVLSEIAAVLGFDEFATRYPEAAGLRPGLEAHDGARGVLQVLPLASLLAAVRGELDLNALARLELASRGLNPAGQWVGFVEAARLAAEAK
jgi:hypothetical protein